METAQPRKELHRILIRLSAIRLCRGLITHRKTRPSGIRDLRRLTHLEADIAVVPGGLSGVGHALDPARGLQAGGGEVNYIFSNKTIDTSIRIRRFIPIVNKY